MNKTKKDFVLSVVAAAVMVSLANTNSALAADGAAQAENFVTSIIKTLIGFAGIIAVAMVAWGGIRYMTSSGNPEHLEKAKKTLWYAVIGSVICFAAYAIVDWVSELAKSSFGG